MSKLLKSVGINIREARKKYSISQEELANKSGLDRTYISSIERGQKNVSILSLEKISKALDVSISSFFKKNEDS